MWVLSFLSFYVYHLLSQITCSTIYNPIIKYKAKLSKNNIHLRGNQQMTTSSDCQPLFCQNTFYRQFISAYKFTNHNLPISRYTQALGHNPLCHPSTREKGDRMRHKLTHFCNTMLILKGEKTKFLKEALAIESY